MPDDPWNRVILVLAIIGIVGIWWAMRGQGDE